MNFSNKGTVSISGTVVVECDQNTRKRVDYIKLLNSSAYVIYIDVYDAYTSTTVRTHSYSLSAGDHFIEDDPIYLEKGDKITITSDIANTTYMVTGEEIDLRSRR